MIIYLIKMTHSFGQHVAVVSAVRLSCLEGCKIDRAPCIAQVSPRGMHMHGIVHRIQECQIVNIAAISWAFLTTLSDFMSIVVLPVMSIFEFMALVMLGFFSVSDLTQRPTCVMTPTLCVCVCVCACARACVRACMHASMNA